MQIEGNLVDILNKKIYPAKITIKGKNITKIEKIEKAENYILPGFIDSHIHIESSMLPPTHFAKIAVTHGTVATISDPHEIANVLGIDGVKWMIENSKKTDFKIYFGASPCVPATPFETSGAVLGVKEIETLLQKKEILYLSEVMNFPGVINGDKEILSKIEIAKKYNKKIDGHAPALRGEELDKYISVGIDTDHEAFSYAEAKEKIKKGMKILIREGSAAKNYEALSPLILEFPDKLMFCSDDRHPNDLVKNHIKELVIRSLKKGYNLFDVLRIASINPILHYGLDVGYLREGDFADFIVVDNLEKFNILKTFINGNIIYENGDSKVTLPKIEPVNNFNSSKKSENQFYIKNRNRFAIGVIDGELITEKIEINLTSKEGIYYPDVENDILLISVVNRYLDAKPAVGFIKNFGLKKGAIAQSIAHDSHNIIAVATNYKDLVESINLIIENRGGICVVDKQNKTILPLKIAGLMSSEDPFKVAKKYEEINNLAKRLGSSLTAPFMSLSFMALLVIPKLKLSDKGLFDWENFNFV